jgi:hypothetical protein
MNDTKQEGAVRDHAFVTTRGRSARRSPIGGSVGYTLQK